MLYALALAPGLAGADSAVTGKGEIAFTMKQMGVNFDGRFRTWKANIDFRPAALDRSKAEIDVDLASLDLASAESEAVFATTSQLSPFFRRARARCARPSAVRFSASPCRSRSCARPSARASSARL